MNYCIEKGIECNNADYQGWCNSTKCCDKTISGTISGGKENSITYTIKNDNIIANSLISSKPSWCDRPEPCAECAKAAYCADVYNNHKKPFEVREDGIYKSRPDLGENYSELVIPKETFIEAYRTYIANPNARQIIEETGNKDEKYEK